MKNARLDGVFPLIGVSQPSVRNSPIGILSWVAFAQFYWRVHDT